MDPVTLIVTALAAGAASALQDDAREAVKAAYARLRDGLKRRLSGRPAGEMILAQHEAEPDAWEHHLRTELVTAGAADDADLVAAAQALMKLVDEAGSRSGKYTATVRDNLAHARQEAQ
jgi:hypothetical protein